MCDCLVCVFDFAVDVCFVGVCAGVGVRECGCVYMCGWFADLCVWCMPIRMGLRACVFSYLNYGLLCC